MTSNRKALREAFLREVELSLDEIKEFPESAPVVAEAVRKRLVCRFPLAVLYSVNDPGIRVLAIMNLKRRPFYWAGRR
jgi:toxin ParE1/3/4